MALPFASLFASNPLFQGGLALGMIGGLIATLRSYPARLYHYIKNKFIVTVYMRSSEDAYDYVMEWLAKHPYGKKTKNLKLGQTWKNGQSVPEIYVGVGNHVLKYKGRRLWFTIERQEPKDKWSDPMESITINSFLGGRKFIEDFVNDVWLQKFEERKDSVMLFSQGESSSGWNITGYADKRPLNSLVYNNHIAEDILTDIRNFCQERDWYKAMHIPHTRGFLLYGEPGNGKSSLIRAIATELGWNICMLNLNSTALSDEKLQRILSTVPEKMILVMEDIDCLFDKMIAPTKKPTKKEEDDDLEEDGFNRQIDFLKGLTFSGLLNALDGIYTTPTRIIFMTTNRRETLDKALLRPGRLDKQIYIGNATKKQIAEMYVRFFGEDKWGEACEYANQFKDGEISMAILQEKLLTIKEQKRNEK